MSHIAKDAPGERVEVAGPVNFYLSTAAGMRFLTLFEQSAILVVLPLVLARRFIEATTQKPRWPTAYRSVAGQHWGTL